MQDIFHLFFILENILHYSVICKVSIKHPFPLFNEINFHSRTSAHQPCRYTISAAYASFLNKDLGSLSPGKLADFVILSTDSWDDFEAQGSASIEATYTGGKQAYP